MLISRSSRIAFLLSAALFAIGCGAKSDQATTRDSGNRDGGRKADAASLAQARRALQTGDAGLAAEIAERRLVSHPDDLDAVLVAAQAEAARGNHARAAVYAESIESGSDLNTGPGGLGDLHVMVLVRES